MEVAGSVALVTGANRGLGKAYCAALRHAGAKTVYAGARNPARIDDTDVTPIQLDITDPASIARAVAACPDVRILVNNAGIFEIGSLMADDAIPSLERQFAVNAVGPLAMSRAFAPVIERNGGGAIVNMLSVTSWFTTPFGPAYSASKHAALAITDGLRVTLADHGIHVAAVYAGFIDTDMSASVALPKVSAPSVAEATIAGLRANEDHIFADSRSREVWRAMREDPYGFMARLPKPEPISAG